MKLLTILSLFIFATNVANASTVAVIDSGTDMLHKDISPQAWINPLEIPRNERDEDRNGYQDDVHGWNFAEGNAQVIDYKYLGTLTFDVRRFFEIQTKMFYGTVTDEELTWLRAKVEDQDFIKQLQVYGNFMHGTHVSGIAIKDSVDAKVLAVKLIPTEVKLPGQKALTSDKGLGMWLLKQALGALAGQQMKLMEEIGAYVNGHKADVANGSFGTGYPQAKMIVTLLANTFMKEPTEEQIDEATKHFLDTLIREGAHMVNAAPKTLFVFAAGNDGLNNDKFPTSPTNIQAANVLSVAATLGGDEIASFSNYGTKMVDVAAPGVGIDSTVPGSQYLKVSGTSQAAPYVANIASRIKDANKNLVPGQVKKIIMETVDIRTFLKNKVKTSGIVNTDRAVRAAELSRTMGLGDAINIAHSEVKATFTKKSKRHAKSVQGFVLPLPKQFIIR